jgi:hypothetical protein
MNPNINLTNDLDTATGERTDKAFKTLAAHLALAGQQIQRTDPHDGDVAYFVTRWGMTRRLPTLDDAWQLARQLGGQHDHA